ncbi:hypothetical protein BFO_1111 [Tannerella forsythia 92A2]|uniref:Uncharacterized protein n=1 Tax=Tannerella forsythia (strain ATCC 43037 / JCM 10827 / CCUG 21028 A / KCTC 5666 / FDC 338) TaxID=203275 RepID=G8UHU2_TANFA|nr:hypothetical protein BFO_1111 [Tannerella forsythia 92A2]
MHIKAGNCSSSVHNYFFKFFSLQDSKIVAKNTQRRGQKTERRPCVFICPV